MALGGWMGGGCHTAMQCVSGCAQLAEELVEKEECMRDDCCAVSVPTSSIARSSLCSARCATSSSAAWSIKSCNNMAHASRIRYGNGLGLSGRGG